MMSDQDESSSNISNNKEGSQATRSASNNERKKSSFEMITKSREEEIGEELAKVNLEKASLGDPKQVIRPTKKRYFILFMFILLSLLKSFQWICLASITNVAAKFYGVDNMAINWTANIFMLTFLTMAIPVGWIIERIGLRRSVLIGAIGTTLGSIIKCFSCFPAGFYVNFTGHLMIAFAEPFYFSIYSQIASTWFPDHQVGLATSVGIMGEELGMALGFLLPTILIGGHPAALPAGGGGSSIEQPTSNSSDVELGLFKLFTGLACLCSINTLSIAFFFDEQPKFAPGIARFKQLQANAILKNNCPQTISFRESLKSQWKLLKAFLTDQTFLFLLIAFGLNVGTGYSIKTILNQMIVGSPSSSSLLAVEEMSREAVGNELNNEQDINSVVSHAGLLLITVGAIGTILSGWTLDKFHFYRLTTILTYLLSLFTMLSLAFGLNLGPTMLYLAVLPFGFFIGAYLCAGFELGVELTYPRPEFEAQTLLQMSSQMFGIPISLASSAIVDAYGGRAAGGFYASILLVGLILTCLQGGEMKRQQAIESSNLGAPIGCDQGKASKQAEDPLAIA